MWWTAGDFNPRSPCGERPGEWEADDTGVLFQSTLSLRRATKAWAYLDLIMNISIHALLAESDPISRGADIHTPISIHALLAESDVHLVQVRRGNLDFNPRSPCGERPEMVDRMALRRNISIHALLAESDVVTCALIWAARSISIHALLAESDQGICS